MEKRCASKQSLAIDVMDNHNPYKFQGPQQPPGVTELEDQKESSIRSIPQNRSSTISSMNPKNLTQLDTMLRNSFSAIKEEFEDHLQTINENTSEIKCHENHMNELDVRITKLEEKIDMVQLMIKEMISQSRVRIELTRDEQKTFLILYTHDDFLPAQRIAAKVDMNTDSVEEGMRAMQDKGIPIVMNQLQGKPVYKLDETFKQRQAQHQIITIDADVTRQYQNRLLKAFFDN